MSTSFTTSAIFNTTKEELFNAWLDSEQHSHMTGGEAVVSNTVGDEFTAWDSYISGVNKLILPYEEIQQSWRTTDFQHDEHDSFIIIRLKNHADGTELEIEHTNIPEGQPDYKQGWEDHYFTPMRDYFGNKM